MIRTGGIVGEKGFGVQGGLRKCVFRKLAAENPGKSERS